MKNAIVIAIFLLVLWGIFGLMDGVGFFGGIRNSLVAIWKLMGIAGRIIVFAIIVGVIIKVKN